MDKDLIELSGEDQVKQSPKYILPVVRLQGREGKFYKYDKDEENNPKTTELADVLEGVILKVRRTWIGFGKDYVLFSNEHNTWREKTILFEKKDGETKMIDNGTGPELKARNKELKMVQVLYFMLEPNKEVVKLLIKGKGLSDLFNYWQGFKSNEHVFQFITKIGIKEGSSPLGKYYYTSFERKEIIDDFEPIAVKIREIAGKIAEVEAFYKDRPEEKVVLDEVDGEIEIPIIEENSDVDVKDIPF